MKRKVNAYTSISPNIGDKVISDSAIQILQKEGINVDLVMPVNSSKNPLYEDFKFADINIVVGHPLYGLGDFALFLSAARRHKAANTDSKFFALGLGLRGNLGDFDEQHLDLSIFDAIATRDDNLFIHLNNRYENIFKSACLSFFIEPQKMGEGKNKGTALVFPVLSSFAELNRIDYGLEYWRNLFKYLRSVVGIERVDIGLVDPRDEFFFDRLCDKKTRCLSFTDLEQLKLVGEYHLIVSARLHMAVSAARYCPNLKIIPIDRRVAQLLAYSVEKIQPPLPPTYKNNLLGQRKAIFRPEDLVDFLDNHRFNYRKNKRYPKQVFKAIKTLLTD
jgi:hypothetical protein